MEGNFPTAPNETKRKERVLDTDNYVRLNERMYGDHLFTDVAWNRSTYVSCFVDSGTRSGSRSVKTARYTHHIVSYIQQIDVVCYNRIFKSITAMPVCESRRSDVNALNCKLAKAELIDSECSRSFYRHLYVIQ